MDVTELAAHLLAAATDEGTPRAIIGIAGPPGGGKTTLARALCEATGFAHAPGDGFINDETYVDDAGETRERGSVSGFDTAAYVRLLTELTAAAGLRDVAVPHYRHTIDGRGATALGVHADAVGVITECNFLASPTHGWPDVRAQLTVLVYLHETWDECRPRLIARQLAKGRTPAEAAARVDSHDHANYLEVVAHGRSSADVAVTSAELGLFAA